MERFRLKSSALEAIFYFIGRYKILFAITTFFMLVTSLFESLSVASFFPLFAIMLADTKPNATGILGTASEFTDSLPFSNPMVAASVLLIVLFSAKILFNFVTAIMIGLIQSRVVYDVKRSMVDRYSSAHYQYFLDQRQGDLLYNTLDAPPSVGSVLAEGARLGLLIFKGLALIIILFASLPWAAVAALGLAISYYLFVHYLSNKISYKIGKRQAESGSDQTTTMQEFFTGFRQIISFNQATRWINKFDQSNRLARALLFKNAVWQAIPRSALEIAVVTLMLGLIMSMRLGGSSSFSELLPRLGVFTVAMSQLMPTVGALGLTRWGIMRGLPNMERVYSTLIGPIPIRKNGYISLESFDNEISFEDLSFSYDGRSPVFSDVNFSIEKGKITAIVGSSGAGKTTIVNLILGLFQPTQGRIMIDGKSLQDIRIETWLSKIGSVSQDTFTYHASIRDNILFGREGLSQESVVEAARIGNAHQFISDHPEGYSAVVGDRGMRLSGGQQQRLAISRAVLESPEILIFDEATSSLDTISEQLVKEAMEGVSQDRTVIIVAHRLSTIKHADKIIVLNEGKVVEEGNHFQLLGINGFYSKLVGSER